MKLTNFTLLTSLVVTNPVPLIQTNSIEVQQTNTGLKINQSKVIDNNFKVDLKAYITSPQSKNTNYLDIDSAMPTGYYQAVGVKDPIYKTNPTIVYDMNMTFNVKNMLYWPDTNEKISVNINDVDGINFYFDRSLNQKNGTNWDYPLSLFAYPGDSKTLTFNGGQVYFDNTWCKYFPITFNYNKFTDNTYGRPWLNDLFLSFDDQNQISFKPCNLDFTYWTGSGAEGKDKAKFTKYNGVIQINKNNISYEKINKDFITKKDFNRDYLVKINENLSYNNGKSSYLYIDANYDYIESSLMNWDTRTNQVSNNWQNNAILAQYSSLSNEIKTLIDSAIIDGKIINQQQSKVINWKLPNSSVLVNENYDGTELYSCSLLTMLQSNNSLQEFKNYIDCLQRLKWKTNWIDYDATDYCSNLKNFDDYVYTLLSKQLDLSLSYSLPINPAKTEIANFKLQDLINGDNLIIINNYQSIAGYDPIILKSLSSYNVNFGSISNQDTNYTFNMILEKNKMKISNLDNRTENNYVWSCKQAEIFDLLDYSGLINQLYWENNNNLFEHELNILNNEITDYSPSEIIDFIDKKKFHSNLLNRDLNFGVENFIKINEVWQNDYKSIYELIDQRSIRWIKNDENGSLILIFNQLNVNEINNLNFINASSVNKIEEIDSFYNFSQMLASEINYAYFIDNLIWYQNSEKNSQNLYKVNLEKYQFINALQEINFSADDEKGKLIISLELSSKTNYLNKCNNETENYQFIIEWFKKSETKNFDDFDDETDNEPSAKWLIPLIIISCLCGAIIIGFIVYYLLIKKPKINQ